MKKSFIFLCLTSFLLAKANVRRSNKYSEDMIGRFESEETEPVLKKYVKDAEIEDNRNSGRCECKTGNLNRIVRAVDFDLCLHGIPTESCHQRVVTNLKRGANIAFYNVDFGINATVMTIAYSNCQESQDPSTVYVAVDFFTLVLATFYVHNTGGRCQFRTKNVYFNPHLSGYHAVFFHFYPKENDEAMDFLWFTFYDRPRCLDPLTLQPILASTTEDEFKEQSSYGDDYKTIYGADFDESKYAVVANTCNIRVASNIINQTILLYNNIDFGNRGPKFLNFNLITDLNYVPNVKVSIYLREQNVKKQLIGAIVTQKTKYPCILAIKIMPLLTNITGIHDVMFDFAVQTYNRYQKTYDLISFKLAD
ncbi:hypothetical protein CHUAL_012195 [Chamberlinius hualienensis]